VNEPDAPPSPGIQTRIVRNRTFGCPELHATMLNVESVESVESVEERCELRETYRQPEPDLDASDGASGKWRHAECRAALKRDTLCQFRTWSMFYLWRQAIGTHS